MINSTNSIKFLILNHQRNNNIMSIQNGAELQKNSSIEAKGGGPSTNQAAMTAVGVANNVNLKPTAIQMQPSTVFKANGLVMKNHSTSLIYLKDSNDESQKQKQKQNPSQCQSQIQSENQIKKSAFNSVNNSIINSTTHTSSTSSLNKSSFKDTNGGVGVGVVGQQPSPEATYAFQQIADVHNYAKSNHYGDSQEFSDSSIQEDEEDEDEDLPDVDLNNYSVDNYIHYFDRRQRSMSESIHQSYGHLNKNKMAAKICRTISEDSEYIDVETVPKDSSLEATNATNITPDHHARRPMNAFLIFCKRHRAIVKERYKTFENRAITRVLGDWWASLQEKDKVCFTELAKMNKDAFFSANPNFKWYKLPAPPLRTLNTRPSNFDRSTTPSNSLPINENFSSTETITQTNKNNNNNFFKFADVNQMGELSSLMNEGPANKSQMPQSPNEQQYQNNFQRSSAEALIRGKPYRESSFSSNSSEEDASPRKLSRSCKGKIYQELINSGQIAPITKKTKTPGINFQQKIETSTANFYNNINNNNNNNSNNNNNNYLLQSFPLAFEESSNKLNLFNRRSFSESETININLANFDLEERIKELPALSLDEYLARKRDTKKKKKFTPKKRPNNTNTFTNSPPNSFSNKTNLNPESKNLDLAADSLMNSKKINEISSAEQVVGSRKRKARKESITRRDVSAIENEVTALLPSNEVSSSLGGACYYLNKIPNVSSQGQQEAAESSSSKISSLSISSLNMNDFVDMNSNVSGPESMSASTSDLFILAEVAAKRTELMN